MASLITIVATEHDGLTTRSMAINLEIISENIKTADDIKAAVSSACNDYIRTKEGIATYEYNCGCFNWADFAANVPNSICEKYGFKQIASQMNDIEVDWDEHLITNEPDKN